MAIVCNLSVSTAQRPSLTMTVTGVKQVLAELESAPLFKKELDLVTYAVDKSIQLGISVPIPKDMAGGYTHEQHKRNYKLMHNAGKLYQFTNDEKYAKFVKEMMMQYAAMYPTLPIHPTQKSYATGKIFWQCLNDANWLVFTSQAYDCIHDYLSEEDRIYLETNLFIPFSNFLSEENPKFFNRVHNHSTWANAAVGLMALAMDNDSLLQKALYGLSDDGIDPNELDNDGGFIKKEGESQAGFFAQLDYSFTPEGYFSEGPYYQRYAIFPFLVFSHALHNKKPEFKIFEYRNEILKKATNTLLQLTDPQGSFFAINDAQKGMTYKAFEVVTAVDLIYAIDPSQEHLLDWAAKQGKVSLDEAGFLVAKKLASAKTEEPIKKSLVFGDGVNGDQGGVSVLRLDETELLFKFSTHGMGHGHYDRLSYSLYDKAGEILQDYGAVRWVNIDQKAGGRYLPENKTFGKQTIAHNTITINTSSQFEGKIKKAETSAPILYTFNNTDPNLHLVSAIEDNAYDGVKQHRTLMLYKDEAFTSPLVIDLFLIESKEEVTLDLPYWYQGHFMKSSKSCPKGKSKLNTLGESFGYQHIWQESKCDISDSEYEFNWFGNNRFYTINATSNNEDQLIMGRAGANDPNYNLRSDPVMIHRRKSNGSTIYFNVIESHGKYNRSTEIPSNPYSVINNLKVIHQDTNYAICSFSNLEYSWEICFSFGGSQQETRHEVTVDGKKYEWTGTHTINKTKK